MSETDRPEKIVKVVVVCSEREHFTESLNDPATRDGLSEILSRIILDSNLNVSASRCQALSTTFLLFLVVVAAERTVILIR
jgi:hypothetical protein